MTGDLSASSSPSVPVKVRAPAAAVAASIAGAVFVGLTIEALSAGVIWSLAMMAGLPWFALVSGEALALAGSVMLTAGLARHAIGLDARRAAGEPV